MRTVADCYSKYNYWNLEVAGYESKAEKASCRSYKAEGIEPLAQASHTAHCARPEQVKEFASNSE